MGAVPQGPYWDQYCLSLCQGYVQWIECTLSKFVGNTKLSSLVDTPERRDTIQKDLERLERWACETS